MEANSRSRSYQKSDFKFLKKEEDFTQKEINFSFSHINDIYDLTKSITNKIVGLRNFRNTCFLNSSLQILIHSPLFNENFLKDIRKGVSKDTVAFEFFNFIMDIKSNNKNIFFPEKLISSFLKKCNLFYLGQQSDSQRFYRNIATIFDKEFGPLNTCIKSTFVGEIENTMFYNCCNKFCVNNRQKNIVKQPFYDIFLSVPQYKSSIEDLIHITYETKIIKSSKNVKAKLYRDYKN